MENKFNFERISAREANERTLLNRGVDTNGVRCKVYGIIEYAISQKLFQTTVDIVPSFLVNELRELGFVVERKSYADAPTEISWF